MAKTYNFTKIGVGGKGESLAKKIRKEEGKIILEIPADYNNLPCYSSLIKQGFSWETNCPEDELEEYCRIYVSEGLEVKVRDDAYDNKTELVKNWKAIFTRKKSS